MVFIPALLRASLGYIATFFAGAVTFNSGSDDNPRPFKIQGWLLAIIFVVVSIWILTLLKIRIPNPFARKSSPRTGKRRSLRRTFRRARRRVRRTYRRVRRRF